MFSFINEIILEIETKVICLLIVYNDEMKYSISNKKYTVIIQARILKKKSSLRFGTTFKWN